MNLTSMTTTLVPRGGAAAGAAGAVGAVSGRLGGFWPCARAENENANAVPATNVAHQWEALTISTPCCQRGSSLIGDVSSGETPPYSLHRHFRAMLSIKRGGIVPKKMESV